MLSLCQLIAMLSCVKLVAGNDTKGCASGIDLERFNHRPLSGAAHTLPQAGCLNVFYSTLDMTPLHNWSGR